MKGRSFSLTCLTIALLVTFGQAFDAYADDGDPAETPESEKERVPAGVDGVELDELESDYKPEVKRLVIPPYYQETSEHLKLNLFFPLFVLRERTGKDPRKDLGVFPLYWRSRIGKHGGVDVVFPLYWRYRGARFKTDIVLQTYYNRSDHGYNFGFAPLVFVGKDTRDKSNYQVVFPLFWRFAKGKSAFLLALIYYDSRKGEDYDLGLPPLFFAGRDRYKTYAVAVPPLFWRFTNEINYTTTNVFIPCFYNTREHGWSFGFMPLVYVARDKDWDKTLVVPFYWGSRWQLADRAGNELGEGKTHVVPILLTYYRRAPGLLQHGSSVFYHWYLKDGDYLKMFSPLVWLYGNHRTADNATLIPPLFYRRDTPVSDDMMVSLIYWNFHEHHQERTFSIMPFFAYNKKLYENRWRTWVLPTFDFGKQPDGYHAWFHPIFYLGRDGKKDHLIIAPLVWKFTDEKDDDLVVAPIYWRFDDLEHKDTKTVIFPFWWEFDDRRKRTLNRVAFPFYWDFRGLGIEKRSLVVPPFYFQRETKLSTTTGVLNFVFNKGKLKGNPFWTFQVYPFLGFGHPPAPDGAYWSVLSGLVAWRRQGRSKQLKLFWIPIDIKK
ncbi:MAG: hypothetical protein GY762_02680 [Proteobacteria bacterium]|nr:hypothetical protein [Pseudomonadota bacterium]